MTLDLSGMALATGSCSMVLLEFTGSERQMALAWIGTAPANGSCSTFFLEEFTGG